MNKITLTIKKVSFFLPSLCLLSFVMVLNSCSSENETIAETEETTINYKNFTPPSLNEISYDLSCMEEDDGFMGLINLFSEGKDELLAQYGSAVSVKEEMELGAQIYEELSKEVRVKYSSKLTRVLDDLLTVLPKTEYKYKIYLIEDDELNAFTSGGYVYVYSGMMDFVESEDELYAVVAHEICHNELGHINKQLSIMKTAADVVGEEFSEIISVIDKLLTTPFNQKDELMSDLAGIDLVVQLGYDPCAAINLWNRMSADENKNVFEELLSTHPYGSKRAMCIKKHVKENYGISCD